MLRADDGLDRRRFKDQHLAPRRANLKLPLAEQVVGCPGQRIGVLPFLQVQRLVRQAGVIAAHGQKGKSDLVPTRLVGGGVLPAPGLTAGTALVVEGERDC